MSTPPEIVLLRRSGRHAFTLIEILVVITIVAVLLSMLIPSLGKAREVASRLQCLSYLRSQGVGMSAYAADFKQGYPYSAVMYYNFANTPNTLQYSNSILAFNQYYTYFNNIRPMFCPAFNHFYWPNGIDNPYKVQKDWTPQGTGSNPLVLGYAKYAGSAAAGCTKPVYTERYNDASVAYRDPNGEDPSWLTWSYTVGYQRVIDAEQASTYTWNGSANVPTLHLGAAGVCLMGDWNQMDSYYTSATAHNSNAPFPGWIIGNNVNYVTGMNEVMADGHARWYTNGNSSDGMVYTWDGQQGAWIISNGY